MAEFNIRTDSVDVEQIMRQIRARIKEKRGVDYTEQQIRVREELDALYYEVIHNLVLEVTRLGIESRNLKMRLESLSSRMDFDERPARALEGVVQYKAGTGPAKEATQQPAPQSAGVE